MALIAVLAVLAAALIFILPPILRGDPERPSAERRRRQDAMADATSRRDASYEALADLEFDYESGKISQEDFARLKRQYQKAAVSALQDMDALEAAEAGPETGS